jgi:CBS domain-containing protein
LKKNLDISSIKAEDIMTKRPVTVEPQETVASALSKMKRFDVLELPVVRKNDLLGLLSYQKLIKRRSIPMSAIVEHIMSMPPHIDTQDTISKVAETLISTGYRGVPVTKGKTMMGFISRYDVISCLRDVEAISGMHVESLMTADPLVIREDENMSKAMQIMADLDEMSLPVVDKKGDISGTISNKDLAEYLKGMKSEKAAHRSGREKQRMKIAVKSLMSPSIDVVGQSSKISEVIDLMTKRKSTSVVVVRNNKPIGIITQRDIIEALASSNERKGVYIQISGLEDADPMTFDEMYDIIGKHLVKIKKFYPPKVFMAHVVHHHQKEDLDKFTVHARLTTEYGSFTAQEYDWDLFVALENGMKNIHKQASKRHERRVTREHMKPIY